MMNGRDNKEVAQDEMVWWDKIRDILRRGPRTIPLVAQELGKPAYEVMYWMMSLRKYGRIAESESADAEGFYEYRWVEKDS
jgi:hypothetical protein